MEMFGQWPIGPLYGNSTVVNYHSEIPCFLPYIGLMSTYPAIISHIVLSRMMQVCCSQLQSKIRSLVTALISHSCLVKFNTLFQVIPSLFVSASRLLFLLAMSWQNSMFPSMCPTNQSPQINPESMDCLCSNHCYNSPMSHQPISAYF